MRDRVGRPINIRVGDTVLRGLTALAKHDGVTRVEYIRRVLRGHIRERGIALMERGIALNQFTASVKQFILAYREAVPIAGGLPGVEKRGDLEKLTWSCIKEAYEFAQSEEAASNAKARLQALFILSNLIRVERMILADQDKAAVDEIVEKIEENLDGLEKETKTGTRKVTTFDPKEVATQTTAAPVEIPLDIIARPKKSEAPQA